MPFYLREVDVVDKAMAFRSVLIVPCRLCPAVSMAVRKKRPFVELYRGHLETRCYGDLITDLKSRLEKEGTRTDVFRSSVLSYVQCIWSPGKRAKLRKRGSAYEAVVVVGCEGAYESVCEMLESADCRVVQRMETEGFLNAIPRLEWPLNISLELSGVTEMHFSGSDCRS